MRTAIAIVTVVLAMLTPIRGAQAAEPDRRLPADANTAWGRPDGGLQAGIRIAAQPQRIRAGRVVELELVLRNVQERGTIRVGYPAGLWYSGASQTTAITLGAGSAAGSAEGIHAHLSPGEQIVLGRAFVGTRGSKPNWGHLVELAADKYQVGSEDVLGSTLAESLLSADLRCPKLATGYLDVDLSGK